MYTIYEDDLAETAVPHLDSDGRIEVIWDHPSFPQEWSARWAPYPYDSEWQTHGTIDSVFTGPWSAYWILLQHFGLFKLKGLPDRQVILSMSPDALADLKAKLR